MDTRIAVVNRLIELCRANNMSIYALARSSAIPSSTVKNILYGKSKNPGVVTIKKLCDGFGITLGEFFTTSEFDGLGWEQNHSKK